MKFPVAEVVKGHVHCPICTHTVPADVTVISRSTKVVAGQKCPRCHSSLDAAAVMYLAHAA
jgi:transposase-like protein